jgi:outer membrane murein-binding lipoprotein Lpp
MQQQWVRHREASELGGFNPLATMGMGQGVAPTPIDTTNYMGSAIADSALLVADAIAAKKADQTAKKAQDLAATNAKLNSQVRDLTLRPKIGGVYAQRQSSPTLRQALGAENEGSPSNMGGGNGSVGPAVGGPDGLRPLETVNPVDPRREVDNKAISTTSGFMTVDNPYLPKPLRVPTLDGDEPLQWYDYPSLALPGVIMAGEMGFEWYKRNQPYAPNGGKPGKPIPEVEVRKPFPRKGSEDAFNFHMGGHRPQPAWMRGQ